MQGETSVFDERLDVAARVVVNSAYTVHRALGPGLLETIYEQCLSHEIRKAGLKVECQVARCGRQTGYSVPEGAMWVADGR
ncbi:GxxExxY protein [bacterium]|nr:GxxExxY protein [bacterium]